MTETKERGVKENDKKENRRFLWREEKSPIRPRTETERRHLDLRNKEK